MIRFFTAEQLRAYPTLRDSLFRDRAAQFHDRLGWEVSVDARGWERDEYDALNPLYILYLGTNGRHRGSMRVLPTTGPTMVNDHFLNLTDGVRIESPLIWECTRFCLAPGADGRVAGALMLAGAEFGLSQGLSHSVGVFDARMVSVYRRLGWQPTVLGTQGTGRSAISVGLWSMDADLRLRLGARAGIARDVADHWYRRSFGNVRAA